MEVDEAISYPIIPTRRTWNVDIELDKELKFNPSTRYDYSGRSIGPLFHRKDTPAIGEMFYDEKSNLVYYFTGTEWRALEGVFDFKEMMKNVQDMGCKH